MISIVVEDGIEAGGFVPFQADFNDMDGYSYYARFRHGSFTLKRNNEPYDEFDFSKSEFILKKTYTDGGYVDFEELKRITSHILVWPTEPGVLRICRKQIV
jgi:hypothetical protein